MNLKDAFAGLGEPEGLGAQAPENQKGLRPEDRPDEVVRTPVGKGESRKNAEPERRGAGQAPLPLQGTAKSRHPEFEPVKVYLRKRTRKLAQRKWEDADGGDFSDLVEMLLERYLNA